MAKLRGDGGLSTRRACSKWHGRSDSLRVGAQIVTSLSLPRRQIFIVSTLFQLGLENWHCHYQIKLHGEISKEPLLSVYGLL